MYKLKVKKKIFQRIYSLYKMLSISYYNLYYDYWDLITRLWLGSSVYQAQGYFARKSFLRWLWLIIYIFWLIIASLLFRNSANSKTSKLFVFIILQYKPKLIELELQCIRTIRGGGIIHLNEFKWIIKFLQLVKVFVFILSAWTVTEFRH